MTIKIVITENIELKSNDEIIISLQGKGESGEYSIVNHHAQEIREESDTTVEKPTKRDAFENQKEIPTLGEFVEMLTKRLVKNGKHRVAETYASTLRSILRFRKGEDLGLLEIDRNLAEDYECYLRQQGLSLNTIAFYLKRLRAIYHKALETYGLEDGNPFAHCNMKSAQTSKRALAVGDIKLMARAEVADEQEQLAKDLFLFSYYTRGMSFVDIAFLRKSDIREGYLVYRRKKTGQELRVAWRPCMQAIVDRHPSLDGTHLLGILDKKLAKGLRCQYHYRQGRVNMALKEFAKRIGIQMPVTMYCARHSWATIANEKCVPMSVISDGMGHNSEKTTRIYLRSIDAEVIDQYNDVMIKAVEANHTTTSA